MANPPLPPGVTRRARGNANEPEIGLYHLDDDPDEAINLAATHPDILRDMQAALDRWREDVGYSKAR